jgi:DNA-binding PadR family transcriptional regulator
MMTDAELAILSLVAEGPQHGYQIQQAIEVRGIREWTNIGFSSVYYVLNKLESDGLLDSQLTPSARGPARKVYELTKAGRGVLQTAVADLLSTPRDRGSGFALGLANMHLLRPDQVRRALDAYESKLRSRIADLNAARAEHFGVADDPPLQVVALFDYSQRLLITELEWMNEFRQAWESRVGPMPAEQESFRAPVIRSIPTAHSAPTEPVSKPGEEDSELPPADE